MPRTKRPVAKPKPPKLPDAEEAVRRKYLDEIVEEHKQALDQQCEVEIKNIQMAFKILISSFSKDVLNKTIGQLKTEISSKGKPVPGSTQRLPSQDDGYLTEGSHDDDRRRPRPSRSATRHVDSSVASINKSRRSRSSDYAPRPLTARQNKTLLKSASKFRTPAAYKTPAFNRNAAEFFPPITPKICPNNPLTLLRRPRQGEIVVSMSGSPLMVTTMLPDDRPNCNIPLEDGTILSLQPEKLLKSNTFIPYSLMNPGTRQQLKTLTENLEFVLGERKN